ncbi:hypothetical protein [Liquorilactobacillus satsumensis]|uniref:hypothetical protein n=1 Tax=Liquorilactobacillus satsumensis TaxID=259059 RepID=UPI000AF2F697|nr:hypothetical protein [Liquorilactobacillus satsumensis]
MECVKYKRNGQTHIERGNKPTDWIKSPMDQVMVKGLLQIKPSSFSQCSPFNVESVRRS